MVIQILESSSVQCLFGCDLNHVAGVRSVARSGGCIGNDDIFEVILGDGADSEGVCGGGLVVVVA